MAIPKIGDDTQTTESQNQEENFAQKPKQAFTQQSLMQAWNAYAQEAGRNNKMNLVTIMKNRELQVNGSHILLPLDNSVQASALDEYKEHLMQHLRKELNNYDLVLETKIVVNREKLLYTSQDKYDHLVKKYPALSELKTRLGLELDF